jgi:ribosomal protein L28
MNNRQLYNLIFEKLLTVDEKHSKYVSFFKDNIRSASAYMGNGEHLKHYGEEKFSHPRFSFFTTESKEDTKNSKRINLKIVKEKNDGLEEIVDNGSTIELAINASALKTAQKSGSKKNNVRLASVHYVEDDAYKAIYFDIETGKGDWMLKSTRAKKKLAFTDEKIVDICSTNLSFVDSKEPGIEA